LVSCIMVSSFRLLVALIELAAGQCDNSAPAPLDS
jgi:hypothetical protein